MYHDQGQIALKTAAFAGACTVFMGLGYVYLSVPHGTAYDIAGKGVAQHFSIQAAMKTAAALASGRAFPDKSGETTQDSTRVFTGINAGQEF
jgi:4-hydroxythreonine-4-phosphate dehydrogenase